MRKSRLISMLLVFVMMFSMLAACNPTTPNGDDPNDDPPVTTIVAEEVIAAKVEEFLTTIPDNNYMIRPADALDLNDENPDAVFWVDMRSAEDYENGHIVNAVNIPYAETGEYLEVLPANKQIIFQCYSGQTSAQVAALANVLGFNAVSFQGGMNFGWAPLELGDDSLETTENALPEAKDPDLSEEEQVLWDAVKGYFGEGNYIIAPNALYELVEENPDAIMVLDIRATDHFEEGHIETSINIPFKEVGDSLDQLPNNKPVYVVCYSGQTAGITMAPLRLMDINAISLNRGMTGWNGAELPVVTE